MSYTIVHEVDGKAPELNEHGGERFPNFPEVVEQATAVLAEIRERARATVVSDVPDGNVCII